MVKILVVMGTRPEVIKLAPVVKELRKRDHEVMIWAVEQHTHLLQKTMDIMDLVPDIRLKIERENDDLSDLTARAMTAMSILKPQQAALLLVQGDTTTALCGALAAFYKGIKVGHVEAGLRSHDKRSPFPEEFNRQAISRLADFHFAPTPRAARNLLDEGMVPSKVHVTGNTVVDSVYWMKERLPKNPYPEVIMKGELRRGPGQHFYRS
jgi:UDP-N-acetylglucosamine 2-epimerase (non-hydrolysing)